MRVYHCALRVPYAHTDQMSMVYYANYLVYFEMARSEFLREVGMPYRDLEARGLLLPVVEAHCVYRRPARFEDLLDVVSRVVSLEGSRLRIEYEVQRDGETLASGYTVHACVSPAGKVIRPPAELRRLLE